MVEIPSIVLEQVAHHRPQNVLDAFLLKLSFKGMGEQETEDAAKGFDELEENSKNLKEQFVENIKDLPTKVRKISDALSDLLIESRTTQTTVSGLRALGVAADSTGSSLEDMVADWDKFSAKLRDNPAGVQSVLTQKFGITDFSDKLHVFIEVLQKLYALRLEGNTLQEGQLRRFFGDLNERNVVAAGQPQFAKIFEEIYDEAKKDDLDEVAEKSFHLTVEFKELADQIQIVRDLFQAQIFDEYGDQIQHIIDFVQGHRVEIVDFAKTVVDQVVLAGQDLTQILGPSFMAVNATFNVISTSLDNVLGSKDGKSGGIYGLHYAIDALIILLTSKLITKLGLFNVLINPFSLWIVGMIAAYDIIDESTLSPGEDELYRQAHPGWVPGMAKDPNWKPPPMVRGDVNWLPSTPAKHANTMAPSTDQAGVAADALAKLAGDRDHYTAQEHDDIMQFLITGGHGMDPRTVSWCAAAVGAALQKAGLPDIPANQGGNIATSYARYGTGVDVHKMSDIHKGDVIVEMQGAGIGQTGGHVALATGVTKPGWVGVIEGDTRNRVGPNGQWYGHRADFGWLPYNSDTVVRRPPYKPLDAAPLVKSKPVEKTKNIGSRTLKTQVDVTTTDPHTAADVVKQHLDTVNKTAVKDMGAYTAGSF